MLKIWRGRRMRFGHTHIHTYKTIDHWVNSHNSHIYWSSVGGVFISISALRNSLSGEQRWRSSLNPARSPDSEGEHDGFMQCVLNSRQPCIYICVNTYGLTSSSSSFDPFQLIPCRSFGEDVQVSDHLSHHSVFSNAMYLARWEFHHSFNQRLCIHDLKSVSSLRQFLNDYQKSCFFQ